MSAARWPIAVLALSLLLVAGCDEVKDAADDLLEREAGCTAEQLGDTQEEALPHCSRAIACCKFLKGECGSIQLFSAPQEVVQACNINEEALTRAIGGYREISDDNCPDELEAEACADGADKTRENYRLAIDMGQGEGLGAEGAPSCKLIVDETINRLNDELGDKAALLPEACEPM